MNTAIIAVLKHFYRSKKLSLWQINFDNGDQVIIVAATLHEVECRAKRIAARQRVALRAIKRLSENELAS